LLCCRCDGQSTDIPALAASYGYGLAKNHPFVDGNKRAAFHAVMLFLALNKVEFHGEIAGMYSSNNEGQLAAWIRANCKKQSPPIRGKK
jgi:death on curing protein